MDDRVGESGLLTAVFWQWIGTELLLDAAAGDTTIFVRNPESVSPNEVVWVGDSGPHRILYLDGSAVILETALTLPCEESEPVAPDMGGEPGQVWYAEVVLPDNDRPIEVTMTWQDRLTLPEGEYDPPRAIVLSEDLQRIVDLPNQTPTVQYDSIADPPAAGESGSTVYPQDEPPWPNGTIDKPHGDMWIETDNDMHKWFWDSGSLMWIDANDPQLDLLDDIEGLPVGDTTLGEIAESVVNANETAFSARNLAATADGRVSFSDYDPLPEDTTYYATGNNDDLIEGQPFSVTGHSLTNGIATLTMPDASLVNSAGELFIVSGLGAPYDGVWTIESINIPDGSDPLEQHSVSYRITGQSNLPLVTYDPPIPGGFNSVILNRVEGSVWFTRTRSRLNHNTNPSFEVDLTGWAVANATVTRLLAAGPEAVIAGGYVMRVVNDGTANDHRVEWAGGVPGIAVNLGETWAVTAFGLLESGVGLGCYASVRFYRSDGSFHSEVNGPAVELVTGEDWRELTVSATVPLPNEALGELPVTHMVAGAFHNPNAGAVWYLDGAMAEQAEYTGRYFDGSSYDSEWLGTPNQSKSSMEGGKIISVWELYDGDWVNLDFTGTTQYDADASDLTKGILDPDRIEDRSLSQDKLRTNVVITQEALVPGDLVNIFESGGAFFLRKASAGLINRLPNPSFEKDAVGWVEGANLNWSRFNGDAATTNIDGEWVANVFPDGSGLPPGGDTSSGALFWNNVYVPATPGETLSATGRVRRNSSLPPAAVLFYLQAFDAAGVFISNIALATCSTLAGSPAAYNEITVSGVVPAGATQVRVAWYKETNTVLSGWTGGSLFFDAHSIVKGDVDGYVGSVTAVREAHGFVLNSAVVGDAVPVDTTGYNPFCTGMTPGPEFLSEVPGKVTDVPPNAAGQIIQEVGVASDPTTLHFNPQQPVLLS